jgi:hypothetical protein
LGQVGVEAEVDSAELAALVVGIEHLLAAGQGESVGVEADGDAVAEDLSQRGDVALKGMEEGLLVGARRSSATCSGSIQLASDGNRMIVKTRVALL